MCLSLVLACGSSPANSSSRTERTVAKDSAGDCSVTYDEYTSPDGDSCTVTTADGDDCCGISSSDGCDGTDLTDWDGPNESTDSYDATCNGQNSGDDTSSPGAAAQGNCSVTTYTYTSPPPNRYLSCSWSVASPNPCCGISTEPRCPIDAFPAYYDDQTTNYDGDCNPM